VHAADDSSVIETTAMHGIVVAQMRTTHPGVPVRLAPVSFLDVAGDWRDEDGLYLPEPPKSALPDRHLSEFAATWAIASAARAVPAAPDELRYFNATLPAESPAGRAVAQLRHLEGHRVLTVIAPPPLAALAVATDDKVTLAVANTGPDVTEVVLPDGRQARLDGFASAWFVLSGESVVSGQPQPGDELMAER
jgi:hypothetical protein